MFPFSIKDPKLNDLFSLEELVCRPDEDLQLKATQLHEKLCAPTASDEVAPSFNKTESCQRTLKRYCGDSDRFSSLCTTRSDRS